MKCQHRDLAVYIERMLDDLKHIRKYVAKTKKGDFDANPMLQDAIIRRIETLGEAAKKLSADVKEVCTDVPWSEIAGMRDKLIHDYMGVDLDLVWEVTQSDLKPLGKCLRKLKKAFSPTK